MTIRTATGADEANVRALLDATYRDGDKFGDYFFTFFWRPENTVVAEEDDTLLGVTQVLPMAIRYQEADYSVMMNYAAAVREGYGGRGLIKASDRFSRDALIRRGVDAVIAFVNPGAEHPWQSIGYAPAFPIHYKRERLEGEPRALNARPATLKDVWAVKQLDALYERKFAGYARVARSPENWLHILAEYSIADGGVMLLWRGDALAGYCVYEWEGEFEIKECVCLDPAIEYPLRQYTLRANGADRCLYHEPCTAENARECRPSGVVYRLTEAAPEWPYEKGYLQLTHM